MAVSIHNNIVYGPEERQIPAHLSYPQFLFDQLKKGGDKVALICGETGNSVSYKDILQQSVNLAVSLQKLGLKKGEVVALCSENRFEFPVAALAAMYCGAVLSTLNVTYSPGEITHILKITKPKIIFTSPITAHNMQDCSEGSSVEKIVLFGDYDVIPGLMFKDLVKEQASVENFELADVSGNDTLAVMCSSGTTGLPKGVMLTHINFLTLSQHMKYYVDTSTESNNIEIKNFLALIPWFHAYGFITTFGVLSFHLEIVFLTRFEDKLFLETIQNYKDAQILGINGACRGIELTNTTINRDIVTFTMRDTKTKTAKSFVIRDEIMNIFKNNRNNIILATNTIITAKSHEGVHHFSSASHQQHQPLYTDPQPGSRDPPVYIEHCSPDKIKIDSQTKSSSTRSLPFAHYLYYITIILSLSTTTVHCSQIGDWQQSALGGSNSQPLLPSQREGRASEQSTSDTASSQPESISNIQQTNIRGAGGLRTVTISNSPNMTNVNFPNGPDRTVTISNSPNMSNVKLQYNDEPGGTITVTITNCPNMSNVRFIVNAGAGSAITATLTNCADMSDVAFVFNTPGGITTATISNCPDMSNVQFIFNGGPGGTITVTISNRPNMSNGIYYYVNGIYT
ncbi:uncharacterized protein LOC134748293 isoform X4 [Cydia strobilella]|uniref:uncharacterized protein LOC134748293 isoform X4 n=1 Tax=Cydia strobilella TaxID=1100964 RepID=UPI0030055843